ncbi:MAG: O-methyltransferase [Actinomycetota bacterium]|nr:O-methyltransferase [Rubrobacter sp.]MDQ3284182.1 O-methyltransferase [Actinomycetota bacterium]MDQ3736702.1 O-methyltransferase [Actinomycetota bacterium]MDQ3841403.1 O-methyltransferase [Actinomycetota bacterium]MDQ3892852.1 O-methyltransferase [Actinomycetota bacterium]
MNDATDLLLRIDTYIEELFAPPDPALEGALRRSRAVGLPEIQISPTEGKLLRLLAEIAGVRRILEIGTLGGYSTIHLAGALPEDGLLVSLEVDERNAGVARENIAEAGLESVVEVRVGDARELLAWMFEDGEGPFDLTFIDADKGGYPEYLEWALRLSRPGSLILGDNAIMGGSVIEPEEGSAQAIRQFNERLAQDPRLSAIVLPLIRGRVDGLAIARVLDS